MLCTRSLLQWRHSLKSILSACKDKTSITRLHALLTTTGLTTQNNVIAQLITSYARNGDINSAHYLFDKSPKQNIDTWNAIIVAHSRKGNPIEVLGLYKRLVDEGTKPDSSIFTVAIKACANLMDLKMGEEIRKQAMDFGYGNDVFVESSLLNLYAKCGKMEEAVKVFDKMTIKHIVSWTTMVTGFLQIKRPGEAIDVYRKMQKEGIEADEVVLLGMIQASTLLGNMRFGLSIHGHMIRRHLLVSIVVQTSLVDMYAKNGKLELALIIFQKIANKNVVSWSALISGFAQNGHAEKALALLVEMQQDGYKPDLSSLVSSCLACSQIGILKLGKSIHGYIIRRLDFDQVSGTAVISMYSKCATLSYARALFDHIKYRDSISWNAMIDCYGIHGHGKEALSVFLQMIQADMKPNHATFASLLSAFSHTGLIEEGLHWFDIMVSEYKIQPSDKHYACMVDLLARAGRVEEAHQLIYCMDTEPGLAIWVALLSGCVNHRMLSIGDMAATKVLALNPEDLGIYALVSNFYSLAKKWEKVGCARKSMKEKGMKKVPGYSAVELHGKHYAFLMEDKSHPYYQEIMRILDSIDNQMRTTRNSSTDELISKGLC